MPSRCSLREPSPTAARSDTGRSGATAKGAASPFRPAVPVRDRAYPLKPPVLGAHLFARSRAIARPFAVSNAPWEIPRRSAGALCHHGVVAFAERRLDSRPCAPGRGPLARERNETLGEVPNVFGRNSDPMQLGVARRGPNLRTRFQACFQAAESNRRMPLRAGSPAATVIAGGGTRQKSANKSAKRSSARQLGRPRA